MEYAENLKAECLETVNVLELVDIEVVSSSSEVVRNRPDAGQCQAGRRPSSYVAPDASRQTTEHVIFLVGSAKE